MKHAYLVMAHHRPDLLQELLTALDDPRNDIYLHIDSKSGQDMRSERFSVEKACLHVIPPMSVNWGGPSQIRCEMALLRAAVRSGPYGYYHLLTGSSYPLKSQDSIHEFFEEHAGKELISFDAAGQEDRVRYYWLFPEGGKNTEQIYWKYNLRKKYIRWQQRLGIDRIRKLGMEYKKGLAYWSITDDLARYILSQSKLVRKMTSRTICADEVFLQTLAWSSPFRDRIFDSAGTRGGSLRLTTWPVEDEGVERPGHNFTAEDRERLLNNEALFALKFEGDDGPGLIEEIRKHIDSTQ